MKRINIQRRSHRLAFSLIELMIVLAVLLFLAAIFLRPTSHGCKVRASRINCINNLKQIGLAFRTFSIDNQDCYPMQTPMTNGGTLELAAFAPAYLHFQVMSNELSTPTILWCPDDRQRIAATNWGSDLFNGKLSYFVGISANETNAQMFLSGDRNITNGQPANSRFIDLTTNHPAGWTADLHRLQGNVGLADGSVQQLTSSRLRAQMAATGDATNRLAMPY